LVGSGQWFSHDVFSIYNNSKEVIINVSTDGAYTIEYRPYERDIEGIHEEIKFLTRELFIEL